MSDTPGGAFVDNLFSSVMGTLVPDEADEENGTPAAQEGAAGGAAAPAPAGDARAGGEAGASADAGRDISVGEPDPNLGDDAPATGARAVDGGGEGGADGDADAGSSGGDRGATGTLDATVLAKDIGGLSQKFEEHTTKAFQQQALEEIQTEFSPYFDSLRKHPRMLVGMQVPSLTGKEGDMETLRDADDAREWQEAVKVLLTDEVRERATRSMEENKGILDTVHASIELFTQNKDLVPGTRQFDKQLADRFASMAKPYELRVEGKLHGYTIPVQPLIESLRAQLAAERAKTPAAASAPASAPQRKAGAPQRPPADPPQAGIGSKAGSQGGEAEDFSTLFGTLGLPNIKI